MAIEHLFMDLSAAERERIENVQGFLVLAKECLSYDRFHLDQFRRRLENFKQVGSQLLVTRGERLYRLVLLLKLRDQNPLDQLHDRSTRFNHVDEGQLEEALLTVLVD
jgi:hypothetical protein